MISLVNFIDIRCNELLEHFCCEFCLQDSFNYSYLKIDEKYGSYIGQNELVIKLSKEIYKSFYKQNNTNVFIYNESDLLNYKNVFFKKLIINITDDISGYVSNKSLYINEEHIFDLVVINLSKDDCYEYTCLCSVIMHELLHAYNNYCSYFKKSKFSLSDLTDKNSIYYKTIITDNKISPENVCKRIVNNLSKWEQNAYISELSMELENKKFNFKDIHSAYKEALDIFKNSDVWTQYSVLWEYLKQLKHHKNEQEEFIKTYNCLYNTNYTFNKVFKKLNTQFERVFRKIETVVPKIFYDIYLKSNKIEESYIFGRQNKNLIEFLDYINK